MPVIDAPATPSVSLAPGGAFAVFSHHVVHPPVALLARPYLPLAGLRIDPQLRARRRLRQTAGVSVMRLADGEQTMLATPEGALTGPPVWAPDGRRFALTVDRADGVGLWVADASTGEARELAGVTVCDILGGEGGSAAWSRDGQSLLVLTTPGGTSAPADLTATGPRVQETAGQHSQLATYADMLRTQADEDAFEALATSVACRVDPVTGEQAPLGAPALYETLTESPDCGYLLVETLRRPFSYRAPWFWFARRTEVWRASGDPAAVIADLPPSEEVPRQGVPEGPRLISWEERAPASLVWAEALDGGDPARPAPARDRVLRMTAPFTGPPEQVFDVTDRCLGWYDLDTPHQVLMVSHDRDRRWRTTWLCDLAAPEHNRVVFDRSQDDAYGDPGNPLTTLKPDGRRTVLTDGTAIYLRGEGATPEGNRPFLDRFDLATMTATRLHHSPADAVERVHGFTAAGPGELLLRHESPAEPPNLRAVTPGEASDRVLTHWPHPHPELSAVGRQLVTHDRGDGVPLSGLLHLPPGYDPAAGERLPLVIWAYPYEFSNAQTAGQVRAGVSEFVRLTAMGPAVFALAGYAVLADATMPVLGDPDTMNDTYLEQITAAARAHIRVLDEAGIADPSRVAVGGHSYGAFMTANLLAHCKEFAAGIARSGAYNRTLTPFGFQSERRSFWEAPEVYDKMSPFRYADQITAPLLLIHGEEDANSGTYPLQSERLFQAIQGNGGTARLVMLPHEDHGYAARESVMNVVAEELAWLRRWLGPAGR